MSDIMVETQRCARPDCSKSLPDLAVQHEDAYCSTVCCRIEHGLDPSTAVTKQGDDPADAALLGDEDDLEC